MVESCRCNMFVSSSLELCDYCKETWKNAKDIPNSVEDEVFEVIKERQRIGMQTYKRKLDENTKTADEWVTDAIEEAADMLQYLVALRRKLR